MSEVMLQGVLRMPPEIWMTIDRKARHGFYVEAADRIEQLESENAALREDNERMKERLELIQSVSYLEPLAWGKAVQAAIDAARKEQP